MDNKKGDDQKMDAVKYLMDINWKLDHGEINLGEYEKLCEPMRDVVPVVHGDWEPDPKKYEYHYDHTDCIWYRPEARNRCPVTCAQYRDGWNDAMNYIFRDGAGYRPYRKGESYEE